MSRRSVDWAHFPSPNSRRTLLRYVSRNFSVCQDGVRHARLGGVCPAPVVLRLLTQVRQAIRLHHYSRRTEEAYVGWVRRFVRFSGMRLPAELGVEDVRRFLTALADRGRVSASTQSQALSGL